MVMAGLIRLDANAVDALVEGEKSLRTASKALELTPIKSNDSTVQAVGNLRLPD